MSAELMTRQRRRLVVGSCGIELRVNSFRIGRSHHNARAAGLSVTRRPAARWVRVVGAAVMVMATMVWMAVLWAAVMRGSTVAAVGRHLPLQRSAWEPAGGRAPSEDRFANIRRRHLSSLELYRILRWRSKYSKYLTRLRVLRER